MIEADIIELYRYLIFYDEGYTFTIISDTIDGLVKGIIEREQIHSMAECRTYLEISEFLLLPSRGTEKFSFSLFDVENHNLSAPLGLTLEEQFYDCYFDGVPKSIDANKFREIIADMCASLASDDEWVRESKASAILAMALFESPLVQEELKRQKERQDMRDDCEASAAVDMVMRLFENN